MVTLRGVVCALVSVTSALAACAEGTEPTANDAAGATTSAGSNSGGTGAAGTGSGGVGTGASTGVGGHAGDGGEAGSATTGGSGPGGQGQGGAGQGGGGAGQGGAGDPCAATATDDACDTCRKPACCAELTACSTDPLCVCWVDCIDLHTNDPNKTVICSGTCGAPMPALGSINGVFNCQQACAACPPIPWS